MIYHILYSFVDEFTILNIFRYITFRTAYASLTALMISLWLGPWMINRLRRFQIGQFIREEGPESHHSKAGTPTMGGILIVVSIVIPTLLWGDLTNAYIWIALFSLVFFATIGFLDDYLKVVKKRSLGLRAYQKIIFQVIFAVAVALLLILSLIHI